MNAQPLGGWTRSVDLLLALAEDERQAKSDGTLCAAHLLAAFAHRHEQMLAGMTGGIDLKRFVAERVEAADRLEFNADLVLDRAAAAAGCDGARMDVRHIGAALVELFLPGQAPSATSPALPVDDLRVSAPPRPSSTLATPTLDRVGRDLTALARAGQLGTVVARDEEIAGVIEVLSRRLARNALLVGDPGVGRRTVVEGVAMRLASGRYPPALAGARIVSVSVGRMWALQQLPGVLDSIFAEAAQSGVFIFFEDLETLLSWGPLGPALQLKSALEGGRPGCIGTLTPGDYQRWVVGDSGLERCFIPVTVEELDEDAVLEVLRLAEPRLWSGSKTVDTDVLVELVRSASRYLKNQRFPGKAVDLFDRVLARANMKGVEPTPELVREVVEDTTGLPIANAGGELGERIATLAQALRSRVVGQDAAADALAQQLALKTRGLDLKPQKPNGVFLFTGPTGVGKTELARALADHLFGGEDRMVRLDMSEFSQAHYGSRILGSPPGYVGYDAGSPLLDAVAERPFCVVLLDEIEKAHPAVHRLFLQVFDEGFLTSAAGKRVSFADATIIMTANIDMGRSVGIGFAPQEQSARLDSLAHVFPPEFINRIDAVCPFRPLDRTDVKQIIRDVILPRWQEEQRASGIELAITDGVFDRLADLGYSREFGARELLRVVETRLLVPLATAMTAQVHGNYGVQGKYRAALNRSEIIVQREE
jgi:ATP-dependent Clp protease ATP-binding subunit ClpC